MNCLPVRMFHAFLSGTVAALLLSLGIIYLHESAHAKTATFRGNGWGEQPAPSSVVPPPTDPVTSTDTDGDGIPNTWETANAHNPNNRADAASDFDFDGLTAKQEYELSVSSDGLYGKPLGTYEVATIPDPAGYTSISTMTLVETAKNGMSLVRVVGIRTGSTTPTTRIYTYLPATGQWTWVKPPLNVADTTQLTPFDVNSRGQVVGYYTSSGYKSFLWTPSSSDPSLGESKQFFLNPTATNPTAVFPRRISDTGYLLYSTQSPFNTDLKAADSKQLPIVPLTSSWTSPTYMDVNDFGEYVGTINNPITGLTHTFLAIPNGPFYISAPTTDDLIANGWDTLYNVGARLDESLIEWVELPEYVYPDDYQDQNGNYIDPYADYPEHEYYDYGIYMPDTPYEFQIRKYKSGSTIYRKGSLSDGSIWWYEQMTSLASSAVSVNDWGEFTGNYSETYLKQGPLYDEYGGSQTYVESSQTSWGSFFFNGHYHFNTNYLQVVGMSNDPQILLGSGGAASSVWSDSVTAPLSKLLPAGSTTPQKTKICDNGLLIIQKTSKILQTLIPADDTDGDGIPDDWEAFYNLNPAVNDGHLDSDGDGTSNLGEFYLRSDPNAAPVIDPNSGQEIDVRDGIDTDGDGMPNIWEIANGLDYNNPADAPLDYDRDGYSNLQEFRMNTDPQGAPSYRIREIGPFPSNYTTWMTPGLLGEDPSPPASTVPTDSFYLRTRTGNLTVLPTVWTVAQGAETGSHIQYIGNEAGSPVTHSTALLAQAPNGAALGSVLMARNKTMYFWPSPTAHPITFSGTAMGTDTGPFTASVRISPGGKYVVARRPSTTIPGTFQPVAWKMPANGVTYPLIPLPIPPNAATGTTGITAINDYGHVLGQTNVGGHDCAVLWKLNAAGNGVDSTTVLPHLPGTTSSTALGLSNQPDAVIAGNSDWPSRAIVWKADGSVSSLGTLAGGTSSQSHVISTNGLIGGTSDILVNGEMKKQPFIATYDTPSSSWQIRAVGSPGYSYTPRKITEQGQMYGDFHSTSTSPAIPILWRHGKAHPLDKILPTSSGYVLGKIASMNQNGTLLVEAMKNGASRYLMLTPDRDTDGDGLTDSYENQNGLSPYVKTTPADDADGDGLSDLEEYRNGTLVRNPDTDGDGTKDGWEVSWGLLPLDPADADFDPDGDLVSNLQEFKLGSTPTGIYRIETRDPLPGHTFINASDSGKFIEAGEYQIASTTEAGGINVSTSWQDFYLTSPSPAPSPPTRITLPAPYRVVTRTDSSSAQLSYLCDYATHLVDSETGKVNSSVIRYTTIYNGSEQQSDQTAFLLPDTATITSESQWISWQTVESGLRATIIDQSYVDEESNYVQLSGPALAVGDTLLPSAVAVSPSGTRRIHRSQGGDCLILDETGAFVAKLPKNTNWERINNKGEAIALVVTGVPPANGSPGYNTAEIRLYRDYQELTYSTSLNASGNLSLFGYSSDDKVFITRSSVDVLGKIYSDYFLYDLKTYSLTQVKQPNLGVEQVFALSDLNGRLLGAGPEPFQVTPEGGVLLIRSTRIRTGPSATPVPLSSLFAADIYNHHVTPDGTITVETTGSANERKILRLIPENSADGDDLPDDWENAYAHWLHETGQTPTLLTNIDPTQDVTGTGITMAAEYAANKDKAPNDTTTSGTSSGPSFAYRKRIMQSSASGGLSGLCSLFSPVTGNPSNYYVKTVTRVGNEHDNYDTHPSEDTTTEYRNSQNHSHEQVTTFEFVNPVSTNAHDEPEQYFGESRRTNNFGNKETVETSGNLGKSNSIKSNYPSGGEKKLLWEYTATGSKSKTASSGTFSWIEKTYDHTPPGSVETDSDEHSWHPSISEPLWVSNDFSLDVTQTKTVTKLEGTVVNGANLTSTQISNSKKYETDTYTATMSSPITPEDISTKLINYVRSQISSAPWPREPMVWRQGGLIASASGSNGIWGGSGGNHSQGAHIEEMNIRVVAGAKTPIAFRITREYFNYDKEWDYGDGPQIPVRTTSQVVTVPAGKMKMISELADPQECDHVSISVHSIHADLIADSMDRYVAGFLPGGTIDDLGGESVVGLVFRNPQSGETYTYNRISEAHVYDNPFGLTEHDEDKFLSDAEIAAWKNGPNPSTEALNQDVVFYRENGTLYFRALFDRAGDIQIGITLNGQEINTTHLTLTRDAQVADLFETIDSILSGHYDDTGGVVVAAIQAGATPDDINAMRGVAAASTSSSSSGGFNGFLARNLTIKVNMPTWNALRDKFEDGVRVAGVYAERAITTATFAAKGFCEGAWLGVKDDATSLMELTNMILNPAETAKTFYEGLKALIDLDLEGWKNVGKTLIKSFLEKGQEGVGEWAEPNALDVASYLVGFTAGFITEQIVMTYITAGIVKAGNIGAKIGAFIRAAAKGIQTALAPVDDVLRLAMKAKNSIFRRFSQDVLSLDDVKKLKRILEELELSCPLPQN